MAKLQVTLPSPLDRHDMTSVQSCYTSPSPEDWVSSHDVGQSCHFIHPLMVHDMNRQPFTCVFALIWLSQLTSYTYQESSIYRELDMIMKYYPQPCIKDIFVTVNKNNKRSDHSQFNKQNWKEKESSNYPSQMQTCHKKHILHELFNVCSNYTMFRHTGQESNTICSLFLTHLRPWNRSSSSNLVWISRPEV